MLTISADRATLKRVSRLEPRLVLGKGVASLTLNADDPAALMEMARKVGDLLRVPSHASAKGF